LPPNYILVFTRDHKCTRVRILSVKVGFDKPTRPAATTDGERVVLYIGSPGGLASPAGTPAAIAANDSSGETTLFGSGVYRLATILPTEWVYLPFLRTERTP
jgi:hypothetical protein